MVKAGRKRFIKKPSDICLEKEKPQPVVPIIVPDNVKVKVLPGISREEYFSGSNFYYRRQGRAL